MPSPDGKLLAYSLSDGGTDWRTWHFRDVATGRGSAGRAALHQVLRIVAGRPIRARSTTRAIRCAPTARGDDTKQREVYWHKLGTPQDADERVFKVVDHPTRNPYRAGLR